MGSALDLSTIMSLVASFLVCLGYAPEFYRLCREPAASFSSAAGLHMWLLWVCSSFLSMVYSIVVNAPILVICNISLVFSLTFLAMMGNAARCLCTWRAHRRRVSADDVWVSGVLPTPTTTTVTEF